MDDTDQKPPCNEETAYHETGHAVVGVVFGCEIRMISCKGEEGCTSFGSCPVNSTLSLRDLLVGNVAGYVAEELWRCDLKNHIISENPCLKSSDLISADRGKSSGE